MLSVAILTKNEENFIVDCIDSIREIADEIIVVDSESSDNTGALAEKQGAKVFKKKLESFAKQRNFALEKAKGDWVLYIDADERATKELTNEIQIAVRSQIYNAYKLRRKNFYFGNHEWPKLEKLERLFKKQALQEWFGDLHETARIEGAVGELNGYLLHYTHRDLSSMLQKTIEWSSIEAELRFKAHHPKMAWWRFPRVMITAFFDSYVGQEGWRAGTMGLVESMYQSFSMFITYARLWEMQKNKS